MSKAGRSLLILPLLLTTFFASAEQRGQSDGINAGDISPGFIVHLDSRISETGLTQVETVLSTERSIELPANSVDMIFTSDAYHHFVYYQDMLASMLSALVSGGELIVMAEKETEY